MAIIFLALAAIVGVVLGEAALSNTGSASIEVFNRWSVTQFTQGQLMVVAAALGFLFAFFLFLAWSSSVSRRAKRRERRLVQRDLESRVDELQRENVSLRNALDRSGHTSPLSGSDATTTSERVDGDREPVGVGRSIRERFRRGDRVEEPARPER
jgi:phosphate/sulfate permease